MFMIKTLHKENGNFLNLVKGIYKNSELISYFMAKD